MVSVNNRKQFLLDSVYLLANLVRNIHLRRQLGAACATPHLNFWRVIYGGLTDISVLEWCKLFGSDDEDHQPLHWKNIVLDADQFRIQLFTRLGIDELGWGAYWKEMKRYRDQSVAHHDVRRTEIKNYPQFDLALESAYLYYELVVAELRKIGIEQRPSDLKRYGIAFADQCRDIANAAIEGTKDFEEQVY
jgi:hypothetical protein